MHFIYNSLRQIEFARNAASEKAHFSSEKKPTNAFFAGKKRTFRWKKQNKRILRW